MKLLDIPQPKCQYNPQTENEVAIITFRHPGFPTRPIIILSYYDTIQIIQFPLL